MGKLTLRRILRGLWNRTGHRFIRKIELDVMRRPVSLPNFKLPTGRRSPVADPEDWDMDDCTQAIVDQCVGLFPDDKIAHFRKMADDPAVWFPIRMREDGECWGYMMQSERPIQDPLYRFTIPIREREVYQFDGWVHPDYRGRLIAMMGTNWVLDKRRAQGIEGIVVTVRKNDAPAQKYHRRFGFEQIGVVVHWRIGPWRLNRIKMDRPD